MWSIWLILSGIFLVAEIMTTGFLIFWFGLGALCAMVVSFITDNIIIQTIVFLVTSTLFILCTRKFANKITSKDKNIQTNVYSVIGKKGIVTEDINSTLGYGQIKVANEIWSAKSVNEDIIPKGSEVLIKKIDGVKAVVTTNLDEKNKATV